MVSLITASTVCKRFKMQLCASLLAVSIHHVSLRFLNLCIGHLLTTVLILRFFASLIVCCLYMNFINLVLCSAFDPIIIPFVLPLLAHCYYHPSTKDLIVFAHFQKLHLISRIIYLIMLDRNNLNVVKKNLKTLLFNQAVPT